MKFGITHILVTQFLNVLYAFEQNYVQGDIHVKRVFVLCPFLLDMSQDWCSKANAVAAL